MNHLQQSKDENKKLSILELPDEVLGQVEYYIDAAYVGGVAADDLLNAVSSAMVFRGTFDKNSSIPTPAAGVLGDVYKFVTDNKDGEAITLPGDSAATTLKRGDIIICAKTGDNTFRWAVVPAGDTDGVLEIKAGTAIKLYDKNGVEITGSNPVLNREGSIGVDLSVTDSHTHSIGFEGAHAHGFTGKEATISMTSTAQGNVTLTKSATRVNTTDLEYVPAGTVTIDHDHTGTVTSTFETENKTATVSGAVSSVTVSDHTIPYMKSATASFSGSAGTASGSYKPEGDIAISIGNDSGEGKTAYKPEGTVSTPTFTGKASSVSITGALSNVTVADHDKISVPGSATTTFTGKQATISMGDYTPEGDITATWTMTDNNHATSTHTFNGTAATISVTGNASVSGTAVTGISTNSADVLGYNTELDVTPATVLDDVTVTYTASSKKVKLAFGTNSIVGGVAIKKETTNKVNAITSVEKTTGSVTYTGTSTGSGSYTPAGTITTSKLTITGDVDAEFEGKTETLSTTYTPEASKVETTLTDKEITISSHVVTPDRTGISGSVTPIGDISQPTFTGATKYFSATFDGEEATITSDFTPSGNVTITPVFNDAPIAHTVGTEKTGVSAAYTCVKKINSTFSADKHTETLPINGTATYFAASFTGTPESISTKYTPEGTVESKNLTFSGETGTGSRE